MAANTWNNLDADNDGLNPNNWSFGHVPTTGETATWNATSVADCNIASASINCLSVDIDTAYTGTITLSNAKRLNTANTGTFSIDGILTIDGALTYASVFGNPGSFALGTNAVISGTGYIRADQTVGGIASNAGATVSCAKIYIGSPRSCIVAAGTYDCNLEVVGNPSISTYSIFKWDAGSTSFENVKLTSPGTVALQVDGGTNNPTITITGDLTIDSDSTGGITWVASSNVLTLQGDLIDEITGAGTLTADSQDLTLTGTNNQDVDGCGGTWGTVTENKTAGTVTLSGTLTCASYTGTDGDLDLNGQTLTASGTVDLASGFTVADPVGSTINCDTFAADGVDLGASGAWTLTAGSVGSALHNLTITNCDASGGQAIDATDNCVDGGGNSANIDFGGVVVPPHLFQMAVA